MMIIHILQGVILIVCSAVMSKLCTSPLDLRVEVLFSNICTDD